MHLFILGRDEKLSQLELFTYLKTNKYDYSLVGVSTRTLLIDFENKPSEEELKNLIDSLGGTIRIAEVISESQTLSKDLLQNFELYIDKFNYSISTIGIGKNDLNEISKILKTFFKDNKYNAQYKGQSEILQEFSVADPKTYFSWRLDQGVELVLLQHGGTYYLARTVACSNPEVFFFKDEKRPVRKFTHGTSFRISRMMVNILGLEKGKTVLDPFCGTGTFLIEALQGGFNAVGIDNEQELVGDSNKNLQWAKETFKLDGNFEVIKGDTRETIVAADGIVFEPYMGPFLTDLPTRNEAFKIIAQLEDLYQKSFNNFFKILPVAGRVVCILPEFKIKSGEVLSPNYSKIFSQTRFELVDLNTAINEDLLLGFDNPLAYFTPSGSNIARKIYILERYV